MKKVFFLIPLFGFGFALSAQTGNVGIGTVSPASRLSVNGSISAGFNAVTANYTLTDADYFVSYQGTGAGTLTLPVAVNGSGNFKGRIYKIKNGSSFTLLLNAAAGESISSNPGILVIPGNTLELINTGAVTGNTWEVTGPAESFFTDAIRVALATEGCASCAAYDAAPNDTWVPVTAGDYHALTHIPYSDKRGLTDVVMGGSAIVSTFPGATYASPYTGPFNASFCPGRVLLPPNSYVLGFSFGVATTGAGTMQAKIFPATGAPVTGYNYLAPVNNAFAATGVYYYIIKRPTAATPSGTSSVFGFYLSNKSYYINTPALSCLDVGNVNTLTIAQAVNPLMQVITTTVRTW